MDLDTVMPGLVGHDFGDGVRFAANCVEEDCPFYITKCERGKKAAKAMARNAEVGIDTEKYKNQR